MVWLTVELQVARWHFKTVATVRLWFDDDTATQPSPKDNRLWQALEEQQPEVFNKLPSFTDSRGFTFIYGLHFNIIKRESK